MGRSSARSRAWVLVAWVLGCRPGEVPEPPPEAPPPVATARPKSEQYEARIAVAREAYAAAERLAGDPAAAAQYRLAQSRYREALEIAESAPQKMDAALGLFKATTRLIDPPYPRWKFAEHVCVTDGRSECPTSLTPTPRREPTEDEAELLQAGAIYWRAAEASGVVPDEEVALQRADLALSLGDPRRVEESLNPLLKRPGSAARAALMLLRFYYATVQGRFPVEPNPNDAAVRFERVTRWMSEYRGEETSPEAVELRRIVPLARLAALRGLRRAECERMRACEASAMLTELVPPDDPERPDLLIEGALSVRRKGNPEKAIRMLSELVERYPGHPSAREGRLILAETYEMIMDLDAAFEQYRELLRTGGPESQTSTARRHWAVLAHATGRLTPEVLAALARGGPEERKLAIMARFHALTVGAPELAAVEGYIKEVGAAGGAARLGIAHVIAAHALLRESCPQRADELCVELSAGRLLGRVLPREQTPARRAREHLRLAEMSLAQAEPDHEDRPEACRGLAFAASADSATCRARPLFAVLRSDIAGARLRLSLARGDLDAESALAKRPPASFEPTRTREWLARRTAEVERMALAYDRAAESPGLGVHIARQAARKGQVYEADASLLEEVAAAVELRAVDPDLAAELRRLAAARKRQASAAYRGCVRAIVEWGLDVGGLGDSCRAGAGRIIGRYEQSMEYTTVAVPEVTAQAAAQP